MGSTADQTAVGPMTIVAIEQGEQRPLIRDELASRMLPGGVRALVVLTRWRPMRRLMINGLDKKIPGMWASFLCRKRYVEDQLLNAVAAGAEAIVILGAGFDTLAYRLPALAELPVYEVDLPSNIDRKWARLRKVYGSVPGRVTLVPMDFETQDLADTLAAHGYPGDQKIFVVWEAVTQYLTEDGVRETFDSLAKAPAGSRLVFTYVRKDFLDGLALYGAEAAYQEYKVKRRLWHFGWNPDQVAGFLDEYGWREIEQAGPNEFTARYLTPSGRNLPVSEIERSVCAEKA